MAPVGVVAGEPLEDRPAGGGPVDEFSLRVEKNASATASSADDPDPAHRLGEPPAGGGVAELAGQ